MCQYLIVKVAGWNLWTNISIQKCSLLKKQTSLQIHQHPCCTKNLKINDNSWLWTKLFVSLECYKILQYFLTSIWSLGRGHPNRIPWIHARLFNFDFGQMINYLAVKVYWPMDGIFFYETFLLIFLKFKILYI